MNAAAETRDATLPALRAAIYVRLSKENLRGKSLGIESTAVQLKNAREAIAREGWALDERHVFIDDGVSGRRADRDGWLAALAAAKRGEFDVLVVRDQDRFSRQHVVDALVAIRDLAKTGVRLWSYAQRQVIGVDGDQVVFTTIAARSAASRGEKDGENIAAGLLARAREGRATGKAPFGYRTSVVTDQDGRDDLNRRPGKWWQKHEPELDIVRHVAAVFLETESFNGAARRLNEDGTRRPRGGKWAHISSVKKILNQPLYRGFRMHNGERIEHPELRVFSEEYVRRIDAALERASKNGPWSNAERSSGNFNLAVPFVACGVCGGPIIGVGSDKGGRSYMCDRKRAHACRGIGYRSAARVDEAIVRAVNATLTDEAIGAVCALVREEIESRPPTRKDDRERIAHEIAVAQKRVDTLTEAVADTPIAGSRAPLYAKLGAESDRLAALRAALARVEGAPVELDARRTVANVQKRARELRTMLAKGGKDASAAIRVVLGKKQRLTAHLVTVKGKRGWKLSGRIGGFYVLDDAHHGSDTLLKLEVKGTITTIVTTPPTPASPPVAPSPVASVPSQGTPASGTTPHTA